ncbi:MAG: hypothetical protein PF569_09295 [Candidatus Woesearchaeota archaeon]|nr:hypothetical protein [Candidatus Woesearchaeota archaeon]
MCILCAGCKEYKKQNELTTKIHENKVPIDTIHVNAIRDRIIYLYVIDSCEYIGFINAYRSDFITHKGNCKFCKRDQ